MLSPIMAIEAVPIAQQQIAFAIGLLGIYVGWRGIISKMTGFYDIANASKNLLYGIVVGMLFAVIIDNYILFGIVNLSVNMLTLTFLSILIGISESSFVLFILGRPRVVALRASPPNGWALGLGMGAMHSSVLIVRLFDEGLTSISNFSGFNIYSIIIGMCISMSACFGHALINAWQGYNILNNNRLKPLVIGSFVRAGLIISLVLCLFLPIIMIAIIPIIILSWSPAQKIWVPSGMTPSAKQAFKRTLRQSQKHELSSNNRIRGNLLESEE